MKLYFLHVINILLTILFVIFNIVITNNTNLDDTLWLVPGLIVCGLIIIISLFIAISNKDLLSEILFFINIILTLYYIYPIFYDFL
ncbi:hypothetical protein WL766_06685 [Staphylococcus pasteuri]|uniref:Uncharacterized protein n=1 Tax=Staphylococcus pasteuri_A TaxID=3062664 RepID=A0AAW7YL80_9STAP|nr:MULTISPECIES: hypothetical protein [Staphylococcus]RQX27002.1 hypothetical protein DB792_09115 [Staphylococcus warneri]MCD9065935.1 hypothetical protein [Staphylococcus pasteuri]MCE3021052.1 hypothetical protein [Staphylococcus pasteuri]MCF7598621.1 hypothetical protein [Staphylococcus pasteuri]MCO0861797.1 hypothetical protein [Staphylococcus pasteuri]